VQVHPCDGLAAQAQNKSFWGSALGPGVSLQAQHSLVYASYYKCLVCIFVIQILFQGSLVGPVTGNRSMLSTVKEKRSKVCSHSGGGAAQITKFQESRMWRSALGWW
jgi:hypothetical protein